MVVTYCAATDVQRVLNKPTAFSSSTTPTSTQVESFINEAEDEIDRRTQHAWKSTSVSNEYYDIPSYPVRLEGFTTGFEINLRHRKITTLATPTDKLEVWNGSSWVDWVATKTEGRANDYWLDLEQGKLFIKNFYLFFRRKGIRMTYRYGESSVPKDIQRAAAMLAAIQILRMEDRSMILNETGSVSAIPYAERITSMEKEIDRILFNRTEIPVIAGSP